MCVTPPLRASSFGPRRRKRGALGWNAPRRSPPTRFRPASACLTVRVSSVLRSCQSPGLTHRDNFREALPARFREAEVVWKCFREAEVVCRKRSSWLGLVTRRRLRCGSSSAWPAAGATLTYAQSWPLRLAVNHDHGEWKRIIPFVVWLKCATMSLTETQDPRRVHTKEKTMHPAQKRRRWFFASCFLLPKIWRC